MKNLKLFCILNVFVFSTYAQNIAMNTLNPKKDLISKTSSIKKIIPIIKPCSYTYRYKGDDVLVVFTEKTHLEYFNNKKFAIKSTIKWISETECEMTLIESNLPNFPFKSGTKLKMKITKIKRDKIYYKSTLGGRTWTGKMKKI